MSVQLRRTAGLPGGHSYLTGADRGSMQQADDVTAGAIIVKVDIPSGYWRVNILHFCKKQENSHRLTGTLPV
jgi:hypothetical protein